MLSIQAGSGEGRQDETAAIVSHFSSENGIHGHGNYKSHLSVFGSADRFPGSRSNRLSWRLGSRAGKSGCGNDRVVRSSGYLLYRCRAFSSQSLGTAWEPRDRRSQAFWQSVNGAQSPTARRRLLSWRERKAVTETIVFNQMGMAGSSWPSCLLRGCAVDIGSPSCFKRRGGRFPAGRLPRSLALRLSDLDTPFIFLVLLVHLPTSIWKSQPHTSQTSLENHFTLSEENQNQSPESILS